MTWLRVKRYLEWLWFRVRHNKDDGPPMLVVIDYARRAGDSDFVSRAAFVNGRLVLRGPELELEFTITHH